MTRKDFELIAGSIRGTMHELDEHNREGLHIAVLNLAGTLEMTHERFNKERFIDACLPID